MTALHRTVVLATVALGATVQHAARISDLYVAPRGAALPCGAAALVTVLAVAFVEHRVLPRAEARAPWIYLLSAGALALSGVLPFLAFASQPLAAPIAVLSVVALAAAAAFAAIESWRSLIKPALMLDFVNYVRHPFRLAGILLSAFAMAALEARLGVLRSGFALGLLLILLAARYPAHYAYLEQRPFPSFPAFGLSTVIASVALAVCMARAESTLPLEEIRRFPDEIVFATDGSLHRFTVTSGPGGYELFSDGQLRQASLDQERRSAALVDTALESAPHAARVLLLHGGTGGVEDRILRDPRVTALTVVTDDREVLLGGNTERVSRAAHAPALPKTQVHVAEPIDWLAAHPERYDVILDDLPLPAGYLEGKYYTRYYAELLAAHLGEEGYFATAAPSAFAANEALAVHVATFRSAGLSVATINAIVPTLGVATYLVGSRGNGVAVAENAVAPRDFGIDLGIRAGAPVATLGDQRVVTAFRSVLDLAEIDGN